jgi:hypothetical protein
VASIHAPSSGCTADHATRTTKVTAPKRTIWVWPPTHSKPKSHPGNMDQIRLSQAKYFFFFFDLDDTLHSFRSASAAAAATTSTFCLIISHHAGLDLDDLRKIYSQILISSTKYAFTDGKTSHEYRAERFRSLLEHSGLRASAKRMQESSGTRTLTTLLLKLPTVRKLRLATLYHL